MLELIQAVPFSFAALFPVINPLGSAIIFLSVTQSFSAQTVRRLSLKIAVNTFILLVVVLLTGSWLLRFFGISIPVVQIGGGLVLAYIGWTLLNQTSSAGEEDKTQFVKSDQQAATMAFFPLTMPITAGPGCIAVALTVGAHGMTSSFTGIMLNQLGAAIGIMLISVVVFFCYRYAGTITSKLSPAGKQVITRLSAFINLCIGIEIIWHGIQGLSAHY